MAQTTETAVQTNRTRDLAISFIIGLVLGGLIVWGVASLRSAPASSYTSSNTSTTTSSTMTATTTAMMQEGSLAASETAANMITVSGIDVSDATWVVVYDNVNGKPGNTLGAALVGKGQSTVVVPLLRDTVPGNAYLVGEVTDNGTKTYTRTETMLAVWTSFTAK